jgi:hypothetical protein
MPARLQVLDRPQAGSQTASSRLFPHHVARGEIDSTGRQQWDLNTGQVLRRYEHATGQITSLSFRPIASTPPSFDASISSNDPSKSSHQATKTSDLDPLFDEDAEGSSTDGGGTEAIAESLVVSPKKPGSAVVQLPGVTPLPKPSRPKLPRPMDPSLPALSTDVLLGSCIDGTVMLWDRRVANGTVRAFTRPKSKAPWAMTVRLTGPLESSN